MIVKASFLSLSLFHEGTIIASDQEEMINQKLLFRHDCEAPNSSSSSLWVDALTHCKASSWPVGGAEAHRNEQRAETDEEEEEDEEEIQNGA